jgi:hypothetical protein
LDDDLRSPETVRVTYLAGRGDFLVGVLDSTIVAMGDCARTQQDASRSNACGSTPHISGEDSDRRCSNTSRPAHANSATPASTSTPPHCNNPPSPCTKNGYHQIGHAKRGPFDLAIFDKDLQ